MMVSRYPFHVTLIRKIEIFCDNLFADDQLFVVLFVVGRLAFCFFFLKFKCN